MTAVFLSATDTHGGRPTPTRSGHGVTVLVVAASPVDRRRIAAVVSKSAPWKTRFAANGLEALRKIEREAPAVVLADLPLQEIDGLELVAGLRRSAPHTPVVLMTGAGNEDLALAALRKGAASYVPKRLLQQHLVPTLEQVLAAAEADHRRRRLHRHLRRCQYDFELSNDLSLIAPFVKLFQDHLSDLLSCDELDRIRVGVALQEALVNAVCHGNLEIRSKSRERAGKRSYHQLIERRQQQAPYRDRQVRLQVRISPAEAVCVIADQGPGFDPTGVPDPTNPANLDKPSGRGLLLIRTFMDEVRFNRAGNVITLVKRRASA